MSEACSVTKVGILGGMGPAAGAEFVKLFVDACTKVLSQSKIQISDQAYPEHLLLQSPVADRTTAIRGDSASFHELLEQLVKSISIMQVAGVSAIAIACNTAHAWHPQLKRRFPDIEILHIAREVAKELRKLGVTSVGLLATQGTYDAGVYSAVLEEEGIYCHIPTREERQQLMSGIYEGVKQSNFELAFLRFKNVAEALLCRTGTTTLIGGCTEIPLVLKSDSLSYTFHMIDPAAILAQALVNRAYQIDYSNR
jgi:aspartate racemase